MTYIIAEPHWKETLETAAASYYKLVLVVGPMGSGKTQIMKEIATYNFHYLNFAEEFNADPDVQAAIEHIVSIDIQDGAVVLHLSSAAETPGAGAPTEGMETVDAPEQDLGEVVPEMEDTQPLEAPEAAPVAE